MSKGILNAYRGFTAAAIKSRTTVPNQTDMTVVGTTVECANIDIIKIRNALGISALDFTSQHQSANVNRWSAFGPTKRTITNQALVNSEEAPRGLFEFAGYHHDAIAPGWPTGELAFAQAPKRILPYGDCVFAPNISIGELIYSDVSHVVMSIWNGATMVDCELQALSGLQENVSFNLTSNAFYGDTEVTYKFRLVAGSPSKVDYMTDPSVYDRYSVPNISDIQCNVRMRIATAYGLNPSNVDFVGDVAFSTGNGGVVSLNNSYLINNHNSVTITASLYERDYANDSWVMRGTPVQLFSSGGTYIGGSPTDYNGTTEIWSGNAVTSYDFYYQIDFSIT